MSTQPLKAKIKAKFGSLSRFARLAKLDRYQLQKDFALKSMPAFKAKRILAKLGSLNDRPVGGEITPKQLSALKAAVEACGGMRVFCAKNRRFKYVSVAQILSGKRKLVSKVVKRLFEHFQIE